MDAIYVENRKYQDDVLRGASLSGAVEVFAHNVRRARRQLMQNEQMKTEMEKVQASQAVQTKMKELSRQVVAMQRLVGGQNRQLSQSK